MIQDNKIVNLIDVGHYMVDQEVLNIVLPGDLIISEEGFMSGHGTYRDQEGIHSSLMGTVEVTNKLIIVNPLNSRYSPQVGDIIVGKITQVPFSIKQIANKRWKIDIRASSVAYLSLNSTYIPEQRKKNQEDQFNMRKIMREGDIVVAEIHSINNDKTFNLHTRNPKYGKVESGIIIETSHRQIKRQKHHLIDIDEIGIILGNNGNLYLSNFKRNQNISSKQNVAKQKSYTVQQIKNMNILANILKVLGNQGLEISELLIKQLFNYVSQKQIHSSLLLQDNNEIKQELLDRVRTRIPQRISQLSNSIKKK